MGKRKSVLAQKKHSSLLTQKKIGDVFCILTDEYSTFLQHTLYFALVICSNGLNTKFTINIWYDTL